MKFSNRIRKVEKLLPTLKQVSDVELERVCEWLAENSNEYLDCVRQLFRLQCKLGKLNNNDSQEQKLFADQATNYLNKIDLLIKKHRNII